MVFKLSLRKLTIFFLLNKVDYTCVIPDGGISVGGIPLGGVLNGGILVGGINKYY